MFRNPKVISHVHAFSILFVSFIIILGINSWVFFGKISNYYANETLSYLGGTTATILAVLLLLLSNTGGSNNKKDETP